MQYSISLSLSSHSPITRSDCTNSVSDLSSGSSITLRSLRFCGLKREASFGLKSSNSSIFNRLISKQCCSRIMVSASLSQNGNPSSGFDYDLVIIGAGVDGHGAALHAVENGLKTAIIEGDVVGGTCVNRGCVPSKALLAVSGRMRELQNEHHMKAFGLQVAAAGYDRQAVADHANNLASKFLNNLTNSMKALGVDILTGVGTVVPQARERAEKDGFEISVAKTSFKANTKALAENEGDGIAKLIYRPDNGEILGVHIFGLHAADLIHEASNAIALGTRIQDIKFAVHAHPTLSEVLDELFKSAKVKVAASSPVGEHAAAAAAAAA